MQLTRGPRTGPWTAAQNSRGPTRHSSVCTPATGWLSPQAKELLTVSPPRPFARGHVATGLTPAVTRFFKTQGLSARPVPESGA